ncbi:hypothetical protein JVU11DRAFT_11975 [Chiua virens]|nr:hypothetical protein JVU11DRAFT_11975 [Chiua virens]
MQEGGYRFTELTLFTSGIDRQFHNSRLPKTLPLRNISQQALMSFRYAPSTVRPISPAGHSYLKLGNRRAPDQSVRPVENIFRYFKSRYMYLGYEEHGIVTADIRAVTRAAFLTYVSPFATDTYLCLTIVWPLHQSIETVKVNTMLRAYANQWHVYAGLGSKSTCMPPVPPSCSHPCSSEITTV